jgi:hypothetical protein
VSLRESARRAISRVPLLAARIKVSRYRMAGSGVRVQFPVMLLRKTKINVRLAKSIDTEARPTKIPARLTEGGVAGPNGSQLPKPSPPP